MSRSATWSHSLMFPHPNTVCTTHPANSVATTMTNTSHSVHSVTTTQTIPLLTSSSTQSCHCTNKPSSPNQYLTHNISSFIHIWWWEIRCTKILQFQWFSTECHLMAQAVMCQPLTMEAHFQYQTSPCGVYGRQSGCGTSFFWVLLLVPISIIPPILHTCSFIWYQYYIISAQDSIST